MEESVEDIQGFCGSNVESVGVIMSDTYLKGRKKQLTVNEWDDERYGDQVVVNGKLMTVEEFRKRRQKKLKHKGLNIWTRKTP